VRLITKRKHAYTCNGIQPLLFLCIIERDTDYERRDARIVDSEIADHCKIYDKRLIRFNEIFAISF